MQIVSLHCQMGNQMFQYAFALGLEGVVLPFCSTYEYPFRLHYFKVNPLLRFIYRHKWTTRRYRRLCKKLIHDMVTDEDGRVMLHNTVVQGTGTCPNSVTGDSLLSRVAKCR